MGGAHSSRHATIMSPCPIFSSPPPSSPGTCLSSYLSPKAFPSHLIREASVDCQSQSQIGLRGSLLPYRYSRGTVVLQGLHRHVHDTTVIFLGSLNVLCRSHRFVTICRSNLGIFNALKEQVYTARS